MDKTIRVECEAKTTMPLDSLVPFQDKIKILTRDNYEKGRQLILDHGITLAKHVWVNNKKNFLIDGHQTRDILIKMRDEEGYKVPKIPVVLVKAKNLREAKLKVLAAATGFGTFDELALEKYLAKNKIDIDYALARFEFNQVNLKELAKDMEKVAPLPDGKTTGPNMKVSSDDVHQVQLYFDTASHKEFLEACEALSEKYGTENISDTVLRAVCEATDR